MATLNVNGRPPEKDSDESKVKSRPMMLINEIGRLMGDKIREKCEENPIMQRSVRLLLIELARKEGRTQLELVKATRLKAPTISVTLQKMERDGYVIRKPDRYDMRAVRVYLTEKGREIDNRTRKRIETEEAAATSVLTEAECRTLSTLLLKIRNHLLEDHETNNEEAEF